MLFLILRFVDLLQWEIFVVFFFDAFRGKRSLEDNAVTRAQIPTRYFEMFTEHIRYMSGISYGPKLSPFPVCLYRLSKRAASGKDFCPDLVVMQDTCTYRLYQWRLPQGSLKIGQATKAT